VARSSSWLILAVDIGMTHPYSQLMERSTFRCQIEHPLTGEAIWKTMVIDPQAEIDRSKPPFVAAPAGSKPYYGHPLLEFTRFEGWCLGVVTDPFEADCESGCTIGDAFVEAPDGTRAGLVWTVDFAPRLTVLSLPDSNRWGVFHFTATQPIATMEQLRDAFVFILPTLKNLRLRYQAGGVAPDAPPKAGPATHVGNSGAIEGPPSVSRKMKQCDYDGGVNEDAATKCPEGGSSGLVEGRESVSATVPRKLDPDEIPLEPIAQKDGDQMILKCRTLPEAFLICDELEKAGIVTILPAEEELLSQFRRDGYVEVRVSAKAYESLTDLRSVLEFQHKRVRAEQPQLDFWKVMAIACAVMLVPGVAVFAWLLSSSGKPIAMGCAVMVVPGVVVSAGLLSSYRKNGYDRMAKDLKFWFCLAVAAWLLGLAVSFALS
jgi:hypothetical protein